MYTNKMMIILDNGHGFDTYGRASPVWPDGSQLFEWEFARDIVKRIKVGLDKREIKSTILIPEAIDVYLRVRTDRANAIYKKHPDSFLISVHGNMAMNPGEGAGWEIWTSPGETESDEIATVFFESAKKHLPQFKMRSDHSDGDPDKESKFWILVHTLCPAVLTENLFYDNENECKFMLSDEGRNTIAQLHVEGIENYINR